MKKLMIVVVKAKSHGKLLDILHGCSKYPDILIEEIKTRIKKDFSQMPDIEFHSQSVELLEKFYLVIELVTNPGVFEIGQGECLMHAKKDALIKLKKELGAEIITYAYTGAHVTKKEFLLVSVVYSSDDKNKEKIISGYAIGNDAEKIKNELNYELLLSLQISEGECYHVESSQFILEGVHHSVIETSDNKDYYFSVGMGGNQNESLEDAEESLMEKTGLDYITLSRPIQKIKLQTV